MKKGDVIRCNDLADMVHTSFELRDAGEKFDVSVRKQADEYIIFITEDHDDNN